MASGRSRPDIGSAVRSARKRAGLTQVELADQLPISRTTLQRIERGGDSSLQALLSTTAELGLEIILVPRVAQVFVDRDLPHRQAPRVVPSSSPR
ncbi:MAG: helix-turn-helix domain-containing protein [Actinobacteria bacterium]|nr:helix-turn-helix domain-containing protein [Actinomycetota bacterium]MBU1609494.1 helix-turn-helix domain-containing protein [Actinomycetota bacterium]MBU2315329.1 helix-turn-helix domain-containing protein [Actinomycetota bacterium]MBU2385527.1 helix-turn-helix domain-containing protein [Actinomycetota bacterium]